MADLKEIKQSIIDYAKENFKNFNKEDWTFEILEWSDGTFQITLFNTHINYNKRLLYRTGIMVKSPMIIKKIDDIKQKMGEDLIKMSGMLGESDDKKKKVVRKNE